VLRPELELVVSVAVRPVYKVPVDGQPTDGEHVIRTHRAFRLSAGRKCDVV
jgi:hypothetical protein